MDESMFRRLYEAVAACEAPAGTQVDDVLAEFQEAYQRSRGAQGESVVLGSYVEEQTYGYRGRVTKKHHRCPEDKSWLAMQADQSVRDHVDEPWVSILVHDGGSVVTPLAHVKVVEPFAFRNPPFDEFYFGSQ